MPNRFAATVVASGTAVREAPVGVWLWFVLIVGVNAFWISADIWLSRNNYELLTTEFKEGLRHPLWGPLIAGALAFTVVAFCFHMFTVKGQPGA